jgi:hypothetical protein
MASLRIEARVVADAHARRTRSGWQLDFDVEIAPRAPGDTPATFAVRHAYGQGEAAGVACRNKAHCMRKGVRVNLTANAGRGRVLLGGVQDISLPDLDANNLHQRIAP